MRNLDSLISQYIKDNDDRRKITPEDLLEILSPKQKEFCASKHFWRIMYGGGRGGKTRGCAVALIYDDLTIAPETHGYMFVASQTIDKAKELYWPALDNMNSEWNLGWEFYKSKNLIITKHNTIKFIGLDNLKQAKQAQGYPTKVVLVDEPQNVKIPILKFFLKEVVRTRLLDFSSDGSNIKIVGNPPEYFNEYLEQFFTDKSKYHIIHITMFDNPKWTREQVIKNINQIALENNLTYEQTKTDPTQGRQIWGKLIYDNQTIVFRPNEKNIYKELPLSLKWKTVMGIDLGWRHHNAIVIPMFNNIDKKIYVDFEYQEAGQDLDEFAQHIKVAQAKYNPSIGTIDSAGAAKNIAETYSKWFGVGKLIAAEKTNKSTWIKLLQTEIKQGNILFREGSELVEEMKQILWNDDCSDFDDKKGIHSDLIDALLYSFRYIYSRYLVRKKEDNKKQSESERYSEKILKLNNQKLIKKTKKLSIIKSYGTSFNQYGARNLKYGKVYNKY